MLSFALMLQYAATNPPPATAAAKLERMTALYDEVCLKTFPDDAAVDAAMRQHGATPLSEADVRVTLVNDPGRGWRLAGDDHDVFVFVEMPPYHACSVRWPMPAMPATLDAYRSAIDTYKRTHPGFKPVASYDNAMNDIHVHIDAEQRMTDGGGGDSLMVVEQHITDAARRAAGETGIMLRFVHQIADPGAR